MFKSTWEKASYHHSLSSKIITQMVQMAYPDKKLINYELVAGGCANLNIKIQLQNDQMFNLRVYLRDKEAVYREQKLGQLLNQIIPIPQVYYIGESRPIALRLRNLFPELPCVIFFLNSYLRIYLQLCTKLE